MSMKTHTKTCSHVYEIFDARGGTRVVYYYVTKPRDNTYIICVDAKRRRVLILSHAVEEQHEEKEDGEEVGRCITTGQRTKTSLSR